MSGYGGYAGNVLAIDLTAETISEYGWSDRDRELVLGGKAMAVQILHDQLSGKETAFSGENPIVITTGPLTGTGAPGSARFDIATLSPKDDSPAFSNCGGDFGLHLKKAGYDALVLTGRCEEPRWLEICGDMITFHDAKELRGMGTGACQERLAEILGSERFGRLCIGPAGENLVKFASVVGRGRTAGRAGFGAVFGWKNLKAITVSGGGAPELFDSEKAAAWNRKWHAHLSSVARESSGSDPACTGCPIRCVRHDPVAKESILNELGMDAIAAEDAIHWAEEHGIPTDHLCEEIAYRRGIGDKLAEGVPYRQGKGGKRRGGSFGAILRAFDLPADDPETDAFCRALTEAISAAGQCMFTVHGLCGEAPMEYMLQTLHGVTGMDLELDDLLAIGKRNRELERQLRRKFEGK